MSEAAAAAPAAAAGEGNAFLRPGTLSAFSWLLHVIPGLETE